MNDKAARGATRILVGLILTLGSIVEILFTKNEHVLYEYIILFVTLGIGIGLIHFGYEAGKEK